jgi:glycosyltransferase involved in cell wall biosynthesis
MLPISVIISVYNAELYLLEAINSVLNQSMPANEIIVINDGSTDNSIKILESFSGKIQLINRQNKGVSTSINEGLSHASEPWIAFIDADDIWQQNKLEIQYNYVLNNVDVKLIFGQMKQFISPELSEEIKKGIYCPTKAENGLIRPAMLVHKSVFDIYGLFNPTLKTGDLLMRSYI